MDKHKRQEVEVKLPVRDARAMRRRLRQLRARPISRVREMNTLYDSAQRRLAKTGRLLRLRVLAPVNSRAGRERSILTYKGPSLGLVADQGVFGGRPRTGQRYKVREELEAAIPEPEKLRAILEAVGLVPSFRYEKIRTRFALPGVGGVMVDWDETPIGTYIELEGGPRSIDRAARLLGYGPADYLRSSYLALYLDDCRRRGLPAGDMLFPSAATPGKKLPKR